MFAKVCVLILSTVVVLSESSYLDSLKPCKVDDEKCQSALLQTVIREFGKNGIPEINVLPFDPVHVTNLTINVFDLLDLFLSDIQVKGVGKSQVDKFVINVNERHTSVSMICDLNLKAKYNVFSNSTLIQGLVGGPIYGNGNGKVKIKNLKLNLESYFIVTKKNGEIYLIYNHEKSSYTYEFGGKVTISADNLYIGNEESSKPLTELMNQNYPTMLATFGKYFMDEGIKIVYKFLDQFYDNVPARYYISDDLSPYLN